MEHILPLLLILILHLSILISAAVDSPMMLPSSVACTDELVTFSSCLPFIAVSPNNLTDFPPPQCCEDVSDAFGNGSGICLCYFILQPKILGFPLNSTKLLSLTSVCPMKDQNRRANFSLQTFCSESPALPPLRSITGPNNSRPSKSGENLQPGPESPPPSLMGSSPAQESTGSSPTKELGDKLPSQPALSANSSATGKIYRPSWTLLTLYLYMSIFEQVDSNQ